MPSSVAPIRAASRLMVRELGMLDGYVEAFSISCTQAHALMEIEAGGTLTPSELAEKLNLDPSTVSRSIAKLVDSGFIACTENDDRRSKELVLTTAGKEKLAQIHAVANEQVSDALSLMAEDERNTVVEGLQIYSRALSRARLQREFRIRPIAPEDDGAMSRIIRSTLESFGMTMGGSAIWDPEVDCMAASYSSPDSKYFILERSGKVVGGAGFGPLANSEMTIAELRKMYFIPEARGCGMGRRLLATVLDEAGKAGYKTIYCETIQKMSAARRLYESFGFQPLDSPMGCTGHTACEVWYSRGLG